MLLLGFLISVFIHLTPTQTTTSVRSVARHAISSWFDNKYEKSDCGKVNPFDICLNLYVPSKKMQPIVISEHTNNGCSSFRKDLETKIPIHGWMSSANDTLLLTIKDIYFQRGDYNVIIPNWSTYAQIELDSTAVCYVPQVAKVIGRLIYKMVKKAGLNLQKTHIIGLSLGGQLAGLVGQEIRKLTGKKVARISGVDAVGPYFCRPKLLDPDQRLSFDDADFVDAIHTDNGAAGCSEPYGHVNFYVNCGKFQIGCKAVDLSCFNLDDDQTSFIKDTGCSHSRAFDLWMESILSKRFVAKRCSSCVKFLSCACSKNEKVIMGEDCPSNSTGSFYLRTNGHPPFAVGDE